MKTSFIVCLVISLVCAFASFFASDSIIFALGVALIFILVLSLSVIPMVEKFKTRERKRHECFHFINTFVTTLSVSESIDLAYASSIQGQGSELTSLSQSISELSTIEKIEYLASYFDSPIYRMFLSTLSIYQDQGGDIIRLSNELLAELTRIEETENDVISINRKNLIQFGLLWSMSLAITVFLRFGLSNFYDVLKTSVTFLSCLAAFFVLMLGSIVVYVSFYTGEKIAFGLSKKEEYKEVKA